MSFALGATRTFGFVGGGKARPFLPVGQRISDTEITTMATHSTNIQSTLMDAIFAPFRAMARGFLAMAEGQRIHKEAEALLTMTDEQLEQRGLKREHLAEFLTRRVGHI